jgi:hypothetical protein
LRTPKVPVFLASELAGGVAASAVWLVPPVPTMNWRMPVVTLRAPVGGHGGEAFVDVLVTNEQDMGPAVVEGLEELLDLGDGAALVAEVGQGAGAGVRGQVGLQPLHLWGGGSASADTRLGAVAVESDHVPAADVVAVVALAVDSAGGLGWVVGGGAEVGEVAARSRRCAPATGVLVVTNDRVADGVELAQARW